MTAVTTTVAVELYFLVGCVVISVQATGTLTNCTTFTRASDNVCEQLLIGMGLGVNATALGGKANMLSQKEFVRVHLICPCWQFKPSGQNSCG